MSATAPAAPLPPGHRAAGRLVMAALAVYAVGFCVFWPRPAIVSDEAAYVGAAWTYAQGRATLEVRDGKSGAVRREPAGFYPPGTAALQAPLVRLFGAPGAPLVSLLAYILTGLLLSRWLRARGRSPLFALLFLGYLPALVLGRVAMSDLPSALAVTACWSLIDTGKAGSRRRAFAAGVVGGASLLLRETNLLFIAPLFAGVVLRREGRTRPLVAGAALGTLLRPLGAWLAFGDPFFAKDPGYGFSLAAVLSCLPLYLFALLVLAPLGLAGAAGFRGPRRGELVASTALALGFFLAWGYSAEESSLLQRLVLGPRYFAPLVPILAVALAEWLPRAWTGLGRPGGPRLAAVLGAAWALAVIAAAAAVHPVLGAYASSQRELAAALYAATSPGGALLCDPSQAAKLLAPWDGPRSPVPLQALPPDGLPPLVARDGIAFLALLDRRDSEFHRARSAAGERWREQAAGLCDLEVAHDGVRGGIRLRVFRVVRCPGPR